MSSDMFSENEAFNFIKDRLLVTDARERIISGKKSLLNDIIIAMQTELIFQNVTLLSIPLDERRRPSLDEIKADILSGVGGLCYNLNVATYYILKAIGFKVVLVQATCTSSVMFLNNHVIVHAMDVEKPGDRFLVETGFGFPTFRAIDLSFEEESPVFKDSFIEYKYFKHDGKILRMHRQGDLAPRGNLPDGVLFVVDGWRRFYFSETSGINKIEDLEADFNAVFTNPVASPFHKSLRVIAFKNMHSTMVVNDKTLTENESGNLVSTLIPGGDEGIVAEVKRLFPVLQEEFVKNAVTNWRKSQS